MVINTKHSLMALCFVFLLFSFFFFFHFVLVLGTFFAVLVVVFFSFLTGGSVETASSILKEEFSLCFKIERIGNPRKLKLDI